MSATRIGRRFAALREEGRAGLAAFVTAGDPTPELSERIVEGLPGAGADIVELGMPFTDPMADGPTVQAASQRALANGMTLARTLDLVRRFRRGDRDTPVVLMGYYNPIHAYGNAAFLDDAREAGIDGLIVVDLPCEEDAELCDPARAAGLDWIRLATPTTHDRRLPAVLAKASGFVYHVSIAGITGTRSADPEAVRAAVARLRSRTDLPIAVGFGIRTAEQAATVARDADAAVVGSAFCQAIADALAAPDGAADSCVAGVLDLVRELADGVRKART